MSHFTVMAIGFVEEQIYDIMNRYDEKRAVPVYISRTKEDIIEEGKAKYAKRCEILNAYMADPEEAQRKYGRYANRYYELRNDESFLDNISDPIEYYNRVIEDYVNDKMVDDKGNMLSTYNPESKWDYYDVLSETSMKEIKKNAIDYFNTYDEKKDSMIWDYIVDGIDMDIQEPEKFHLLWGKPSREELIRMYGTKAGYLKACSERYAVSYCVITPDGEWHEPGTVGWFGCSSASAEDEKQWSDKYYEKFIAAYPDNTPVLFIDCHI